MIWQNKPNWRQAIVFRLLFCSAPQPAAVVCDNAKKRASAGTPF